MSPPCCFPPPPGGAGRFSPRGENLAASVLPRAAPSFSRLIVVALFLSLLGSLPPLPFSPSPAPRDFARVSSSDSSSAVPFPSSSDPFALLGVSAAAEVWSGHPGVPPGLSATGIVVTEQFRTAADAAPPEDVDLTLSATATEESFSVDPTTDESLHAAVQRTKRTSPWKTPGKSVRMANTPAEKDLEEILRLIDMVSRQPPPTAPGAERSFRGREGTSRPRLSTGQPWVGGAFSRNMKLDTESGAEEHAEILNDPKTVERIRKAVRAAYRAALAEFEAQTPPAENPTAAVEQDDLTTVQREPRAGKIKGVRKLLSTKWKVVVLLVLALDLLRMWFLSRLYQTFEGPALHDTLSDVFPPGMRFTAQCVVNTLAMLTIVAIVADAQHLLNTVKMLWQDEIDSDHPLAMALRPPRQAAGKRGSQRVASVAEASAGKAGVEDPELGITEEEITQVLAKTLLLLRQVADVQASPRTHTERVSRRAQPGNWESPETDAL
ncbi:hypothetical protein NCLIV_050550 [Neospora caninum Liverpool]|uniref:Uncharacterized protein n=1 Tax=Neospora caninum (strain Liverpool) TaxID=572307 RepID=F0VKM6_NEOCL|nr:hypothetical protein NCLIV_050550 [Neospora caninum Liverpool]CBZ54627.1 hypothetical protein NCLIV_050550 [Neospora caninum Liverpool]CEL69343.1 TPA: hypothetical protein BN1204_050550 [Neospora caninum Liverpool]|eukprot:XP_003884657.1 hypothetical protein NCLIV_050550 [Neospora caninum Liverpool]